MRKKILVICMLFSMCYIFFNYVYASNYEWDIGGLKQMDYEAIEAEEIEIELSFYCGVDNAMQGGAQSAAGKALVYGNLASNYYTGIESVNGGSEWQQLNNGYSLGTNVYIKDVGLFTIEDRGGSSDFNKTNRMDLFVARKEGESDSDWEKRAYSYGHQTVKAKIIKNGTDRNWVWPSGNSTANTSSPSTTTTSTNKLNFKIEYNNSINISTTGERPGLLSKNCRDAVEKYWSKTTSVLGDETDIGSDGSVPMVGVDLELPEGTKICFPLGNKYKAGAQTNHLSGEQYTVQNKKVNSVGGDECFGYNSSYGGGHKGIDLISQIPSGSRNSPLQKGNIPIYCSMDGYITSIKYGGHYNNYYHTGSYRYPSDLPSNVRQNEKYGTNITIEHTLEDGRVMYTYYQHLYSEDGTDAYALFKTMAQKAERGELIKCGEQIGWMGNNGYSTDAHLHFEYGSSIGSQRNGRSTLNFLRESYKASYGQDPVF